MRRRRRRRGISHNKRVDGGVKGQSNGRLVVSSATVDSDARITIRVG